MNKMYFEAQMVSIVVLAQIFARDGGVIILGFAIDQILRCASRICEIFSCKVVLIKFYGKDRQLRIPFVITDMDRTGYYITLKFKEASTVCGWMVAQLFLSS